jgi:hypothetical protein
MSQKRSLTGFLVASLGLAAGLAVLASPDLASADDCGALKIAEVKAVCAKGGKKGVEQAMKDAVKAAKAKDASLNCKSCHGDKNELKDNAEKDFTAKLKEHFGK